VRREGAFGLWVLGDEKFRVGRRDGKQSELAEDVEMTEAFLLRSANVGVNVGSGDEAPTSTDGIQMMTVCSSFRSSQNLMIQQKKHRSMKPQLLRSSTTTALTIHLTTLHTRL